MRTTCLRRRAYLTCTWAVGFGSSPKASRTGYGAARPCVRPNTRRCGARSRRGARGRGAEHTRLHVSLGMELSEALGGWMAHVEEPRRNADGTWSTRVRYRLGGRGAPLLSEPILGMPSRQAAVTAAQHWANDFERKKYLGELRRE